MTLSSLEMWFSSVSSHHTRLCAFPSVGVNEKSHVLILKVLHVKSDEVEVAFLSKSYIRVFNELTIIYRGAFPHQVCLAVTDKGLGS